MNIEVVLAVIIQVLNIISTVANLFGIDLAFFS